MAHPAPTLTHLASFLAEAVEGRVTSTLADNGFADVRRSYGYVFQVLLDGPSTVGAIANELGISSPAVSKSLRELEARGYVTRTAGVTDARQRSVELTVRGHAVVEAARTARAEAEQVIADALGPRRTAAAARTLRDALRALDAWDAVERRRISPPPASS